MKLILSKTIEESEKSEIEKNFKEFLWLVPNWLQFFKINIYAGESSTCLADMTTQYQYREAAMNIYSPWFIAEDYMKRDTILHELVHLHNTPLFSFAERTLTTFFDQNNLSVSKDIVIDELTRYLEAATQDLTFCINKKFESG